MLEIAICDDDAIILKTLGKYFGKLNDATIKYDIYNSADTLYRYVEEQGTVYDVFILDIEMQGMKDFIFRRFVVRVRILVPIKQNSHSSNCVKGLHYTIKHCTEHVRSTYAVC